MNPSTTFRGFSTTKLNLFLEITARRADGYHELASVFHELDWGDQITVSLKEDLPGDALHQSGLLIPGSGADNLALRASSAYRSRLGKLPPVRIDLHKNIPAGTGLGGGSADAAFVLNALQQLTDGALPEADLHAVARSLGADVPFFLTGGTAICTGIGDIVSPVADPPALVFLLCIPPFSLCTARVYEHADLTSSPRSVKQFVGHLAQRPGGEALGCFNRLQDAAFRVEPRLQALWRALQSHTQRPWTVTGSGSALYCPFDSDREARQALASIACRDESLQLVRSFPRGAVTDPP